jgi:hypothetical protein
MSGTPKVVTKPDNFPLDQNWAYVGELSREETEQILHGHAHGTYCLRYKMAIV